MATEIRRATSEDAELLAELNRDVQLVHANALPWLFKPPTDVGEVVIEMKKALEREGHFAYLASVDGVIAGYVLVEHFQKQDGPRHVAHEMIYVHHISVRSEYQRKGVGKALLDAAKKQGQALGIGLFALDVWTFNAAAKKFFQNYGLTNFNEKMWMKV
jgi:diamine N-acetyltransferase